MKIQILYRMVKCRTRSNIGKTGPRAVAVDYVKPLGENGQFELGYRGNFNKLDTDYTLKIL